ncbi:MAG: DUF799 domain-containing protein [Zoogloeaceae bacterium]|jgi:hypothetical protein|nr:DUF799 domain-containing protein [Zoogloeaceae bacterium]
MRSNFLRACCFFALLTALFLTGCATRQRQEPAPFKTRPRSIVVLPPLNESTDTRAVYSFYSYVTFPLAEAGYYVLPVTLVEETFRQNGLANPGDAHQASPAKLREIFGADTALYLAVERYGASYRVIESADIVTARGKLLDLRTGETLWERRATASSAEERSQHNQGLIGMLVSAVVQQIVSNLQEDSSEQQAAKASYRLLSANPIGTLPYGPRSPKYKGEP